MRAVDALDSITEDLIHWVILTVLGYDLVFHLYEPLLHLLEWPRKDVRDLLLLGNLCDTTK